MSANIPADGIKAYMDAEVERALPPNGAWRLQQKINRAWQGWLAVLIICFLGVVTFDYTRGATLIFAPAATEPFVSAVIYEAFMATALVPLTFYLLVAVSARPPGQWRHYSLKDFTKRYGEWHIPAFEEIIHAIRKGKPGAEFEIAALEQPFHDKPVHYGLVLFQISDRAGQVFDFDGVPLRVCSSTGYHLTFDLQAAPVGAP